MSWKCDTMTPDQIIVGVNPFALVLKLTSDGFSIDVRATNGVVMDEIKGADDPRAAKVEVMRRLQADRQEAMNELCRVARDQLDILYGVQTQLQAVQAFNPKTFAEANK